MTVFVFLGPTLTGEDAAGTLDAIYLPPVAQGDCLRVAAERPFAIGIIDGYFERLPAVWHKEILWALTQGIHVFGAASMGALRAAELAKYGMRGVGAIYDAFATGALEDDDEVAVAHGDASTGYRATSEAMVNVRATLLAAQRAGALSGSGRERVEAVAKGLFYPDRSYPGILARAIESGASVREMNGLRAFVCEHRVDQKRADALALLRVLRDTRERGASPPRTTFSFARTEAWDQAVEWATGQPALTGASAGAPGDRVAAEARLLGPEAEVLFAGGLVRALAGVLVPRAGIDDRDERVRKADERMRGARPEGAATPPLDDWLESQSMTARTYDDFLNRQAEVDWLREKFRPTVDRYVVDELRRSGDYARLASRARDKQAVLEKHGLGEATLQDAGLTADGIMTWYFEDRMGTSVPNDLEPFCSAMGISDSSLLHREALREFLYLRVIEGGSK